MQKFSNKLIAADNQIFYYFQSKFRNDLVDNLFIFITNLGSWQFLTLLTLFIIFLKPKVHPMLGWELAAVLIPSHLIVQVLKRIINRKRPYIRLADVEYLTEPFEPYSFPSGHTTASFAAAITLSLTFPQLSILFISTALAVGISRIYLGVHYPSDILIGIIIALFFSVLVHNLFII